MGNPVTAFVEFESFVFKTYQSQVFDKLINDKKDYLNAAKPYGEKSNQDKLVKVFEQVVTVLTNGRLDHLTFHTAEDSFYISKLSELHFLIKELTFAFKSCSRIGFLFDEKRITELLIKG